MAPLIPEMKQALIDCLCILELYERGPSVFYEPALESALRSTIASTRKALGRAALEYKPNPVDAAQRRLWAAKAEVLTARRALWAAKAKAYRP